MMTLLNSIHKQANLIQADLELITDKLITLPGGLMAIVYSHRENPDQPGIKVVLAEEDGRTWDIEQQAVVWDAYGQEALGVPRTDKYPSGHDAIAYGAPHIVAVGEREVLAGFWCTQAADTHARFCRLCIE